MPPSVICDAKYNDLVTVLDTRLQVVHDCVMSLWKATQEKGNIMVNSIDNWPAAVKALRNAGITVRTQVKGCCPGCVSWGDDDLTFAKNAPILWQVRGGEREPRFTKQYGGFLNHQNLTKDGKLTHAGWLTARILRKHEVPFYWDYSQRRCIYIAPSDEAVEHERQDNVAHQWRRASFDRELTDLEQIDLQLATIWTYRHERAYGTRDLERGQRARSLVVREGLAFDEAWEKVEA